MDEQNNTTARDSAKKIKILFNELSIKLTFVCLFYFVYLIFILQLFLLMPTFSSTNIWFYRQIPDYCRSVGGRRGQHGSLRRKSDLIDAKFVVTQNLSVAVRRMVVIQMPQSNCPIAFERVKICIKCILRRLRGVGWDIW